MTSLQRPKYISKIEKRPLNVSNTLLFSAVSKTLFFTAVSNTLLLAAVSILHQRYKSILCYLLGTSHSRTMNS